MWLWPAPSMRVNFPPTKSREEVAASARTLPLAIAVNDDTTCPVAAFTAATRLCVAPPTWVKSPPRYSREPVRAPSSA